jgi:hypothetical protein
VHLAIVEERGVRVTGTLLNLPRELAEDVRRVRTYVSLNPKSGADAEVLLVAGQRFSFFEVPPGEYTIVADTMTRTDPRDDSLKRLFWARQSVIIHAAGLDGLEVRMQSSLTLAGIAEIEPGCPKPPLTFRLWQIKRVGYSPVVRISATVKEDGSFLVDQLIPATYRFNPGITPDSPRVVEASLSGRDVLESGIVITGAGLGPLRVKLSCAAPGAPQ